MSLDRRIRTLRLHTGLGQDEFGTRVGVTAQAVSQWETPDRPGQKRKPPRPGKARLVRIASEFGARLSWLMTGDGPILEEDAQHIDSADIAAGLGRDRDGLSAASVIDGALKYRPTISKEAIPELRDLPGAGEGQVGEGQVFALGVGDTVVGHEVAGEWVVPDIFLRGRLNSSPRKTVIMAVNGESMRPTLEPDDRVIVNLSEQKLGPDGVYVIAIGDHEPQVKRLIRVMIEGEFRIRVVSDNGGISNDVRPDDIRIVGRVVGRVSRM